MASSSRRGEALFISRLILVSGGAKSGKSRFAQNLGECGSYRRRLYVATAVACDPEMTACIRRHRKDRGRRWRTLEEDVRLPERLPSRWLVPGTVVLFDCLTTFVTNLLLAGVSHTGIRRKIKEIIRMCRRSGLTAIFVTNEAGSGIVPGYPLGRRFRDTLGLVNQQAAAAADEVYLMVAGIPVRVK